MIIWHGAGWDVYFAVKLVLQNVADMALDKATLRLRSTAIWQHAP